MIHSKMQFLHERKTGRAMNFRQLKTLITIADAGGFALAIGRLHLSQPAATRQIQALEAELGVPLFAGLAAGSASPPKARRLYAVDAACCRRPTRCGTALTQ